METQGTPGAGPAFTPPTEAALEEKGTEPTHPAHSRALHAEAKRKKRKNEDESVCAEKVIQLNTRKDRSCSRLSDRALTCGWMQPAERIGP